MNNPLNQAKKHAYLLLLLPAMFISVSVVLIPAIQTVFNSMTNWNGFAAKKEFIGLANYIELFSDRYFKIALKNNIIWLALFMTIPPTMGMCMALLLLHRKNSRNLLQTIFLIPYVLSPVVIAMIFKNIIYSPTTGFLHFLNELNLGLNLKNPLTNRQFGIFAVAAVDMWHFWSYLMIIYLAALRQTPADQLEAARLDGAGELRVFLEIGVPMGIPGILSVCILTFLDSWNMIEQPMTYLKTKALWPLSLFLPEIGMGEMGVGFAAAFLMLVPALLLFLGCQEYLDSLDAAYANDVASGAIANVPKPNF